MPSSQKPAVSPPHERLNSWKEIAAHLNCGERTAKRWEKTRALPVRRLPGGPGLVFALTSEIDIWQLSLAGVEMDAIAETEADPASPFPFVPTSHLPVPAVSTSNSFWIRATVALLVAIVLSGSVVEWFYSRHNRARGNPPRAASSEESKESSNREAQELYLRGHYLLSQRTAPSLTQAIDLFTQAIVRDPRFAAAYAGLADSYLLIREYGDMPDSEAYPRALAASQRAISLDPSSADAHCSYAFILNYWLWNFPAAEREFQSAIALDPNYSQTHHWYATSLFSAGRFDDALKEIDIARHLDPDSIAILATRGLLLASVNIGAGREFLDQMEKANPRFPAIPNYLSRVYARLNDWPQYIEEMEKLATLNGDAPTLALMKSANKDLKANGLVAMNRTLAEGFGKQANNGNASAMSAAYFYARLGNQERTLHYLSLSCSSHEPGFLYMKYEPMFSFLRGTRPYQALLVQGNMHLAASAISQVPPFASTPVVLRQNSIRSKKLLRSF